MAVPVDHLELRLVVGVCRHGLIGFIWLVLWWPLYRSPEHHPRGECVGARRTSRATRQTRRSRCRSATCWRTGSVGVRDREVHDRPIWWLYLFWVPDFLNRYHGIDLKHVGPPLVTILLIADIGSIGGGWLSSALLKRGWSVNPRARRPC